VTEILQLHCDDIATFIILLHEHGMVYLPCCRVLQVRDGRFLQFQNGECDVLVCTDIASRGLDTIRVCCITEILVMTDYYDCLNSYDTIS